MSTGAGGRVTTGTIRDDRPLNGNSSLYFTPVIADENPKRDLAPRGGDAH